MSAKKSFNGTPYARPPSTPKQQLARRGSAPGSILKTLFSPATWFNRKPGFLKEIQQRDTEDSASSSDEEDQDDEEGTIGLEETDHPQDQTFIPNTSKNSPSTPLARSGHGSQSASNRSSPNAVLATFFNSKGDAPLTAIEIEGVKAILSKQSENSPQHTPEQTFSPPRYATPYQPIFTPIKVSASTKAVTEGRPLRRRILPSASVSSPFRHRGIARSSFTVSSAYPKASTPSKYELNTTIVSGEAIQENGKRTLDEVVAPAAKRSKPDSVTSANASSSTAPLGSRTAASMLEILDSSNDESEQTSTKKSLEQLQPMLNPYASPGTNHRPASSPRRTPVRKQPRSAIEEIARNDAIERRVPYQPKKASGLSNSFSADEETSLFSPKRKIQMNLSTDTQQEHKNHGGFAFGGTQIPTAAAENTPTKAQTSLTTAFGTTSGSMFGNNPAAHSMTPKFSFTTPKTDSVPPGINSEDATSTIDAFKPDQSATVTDGDEAKHQNNGGFAFGALSKDKDTEVPSIQETDNNSVTSLSQDSDGMEKDKTTEPLSFGFASHESTNRFEEDSTENNAVVHQLRDGTEYISPSKPRPKSSTEETGAASTTGFVFSVPDSTETPSAFTFGNYKEPSVATSGGFSFDPSKNVSIIGKTIGAQDPRSRALAVPDADLRPFEFTIVSAPNNKSDGDLKSRVLAADLVTFHFSGMSPINPVQKKDWVCDVCMVPNSQAATKCVCCEADPPVIKSLETAPAAFNWAAAGMSKPTSQWQCSVCMTSNPLDKTACLACEADR